MRHTLLTKRETADLLRVSLRTVNRYMVSGSLNPIRLSSRAVRFEEAEVEALIESKKYSPMKRNIDKANKELQELSRVGNGKPESETERERCSEGEGEKNGGESNGEVIYECTWRNKWLTSHAKSIDEMIEMLQSAVDELQEMCKAGVRLDTGSSDVSGDYADLITCDPEVAKRFGFHERSYEDNDCEG